MLNIALLSLFSWLFVIIMDNLNDNFTTYKNLMESISIVL